MRECKDYLRLWVLWQQSQEEIDAVIAHIANCNVCRAHLPSLMAGPVLESSPDSLAQALDNFEQIASMRGLEQSKQEPPLTIESLASDEVAKHNRARAYHALECDGAGTSGKVVAHPVKCERQSAQPLVGREGARAWRPRRLVGPVLSSLLAAGFAFMIAKITTPTQVTPPVSVSRPAQRTIERSSSPKLEILRDGAHPLTVLQKDYLQLQPSGVPSGAWQYILEFGGDGQATLYAEGTVKHSQWRWQVDKPLPTITILLLVSDQELQVELLTAQINALHITPTLPPDTQIVWETQGWRKEHSAREGHGPQGSNDLRWAEHVFRVLTEVPGLHISGWTLPVEARH
jgi:hypothetical protein